MARGGTEQEAWESQRRLEGIVASAMDAIITINEEQKIILFNPAAEQMFGVSREEAIGQPISRFIPLQHRDQHEEHIRRFRKTGVTGRRMGALGSISGVRTDGTEFPIEASISQVDLQGERLATVILRDITERIASEKSRLLLAREVDHRAKNALAVVQALVSLTTAPSKEAYVAAVRGRVAALGRAHSLLAQNRWTGGELAKVIGEEASPYCKPGQVRLTGPSVLLAANAVQPVSLMIHELATNAVKYGAFATPLGRVSIAWQVTPTGSLKLSWIESGLAAPVEQPASAGFGSTLIETVARQLGGDVQTEWQPGGIRVVAELPASSYRLEAANARNPVAAAPEPASAPGPRGKLLIVEDELLVAMEVSRALQAAGWAIVGPAATVEQAFKMIAEEKGIVAAVLDINLNGEMAYPVADLLEAHAIPFVFCTGYETAGSTDRHQQAPILKKPANLDALIETLEELTRRPPPSGDRKAA